MLGLNMVHHELMNSPPPPIEGTGIVLQTDEDIAKWIAERKSKWPSAKRLAERVRLLRKAITNVRMQRGKQQ